MKINQELANYLLSLPKNIVGNSCIDIQKNKIVLKLISPEDNNWEFSVDIINNRKKSFKITLHHRENKNNYGLTRVDFNGGHTNPVDIIDSLPLFFHRYAGYEFVNESHIHIFVDGYRDLAWAIPLQNHTEFMQKEIIDTDSHLDAIKEFAKHINIIGTFTFQDSLI